LYVGTILFKKIGRAGPFILIGSVDLGYAAFVIVMVLLGFFGKTP
jgi:hypothetical protein